MNNTTPLPTFVLPYAAQLSQTLHLGQVYGKSGQTSYNYFDVHLVPVMGRVMLDARLSPDLTVLAGVVALFHDSVEDHRVDELTLYHSLLALPGMRGLETELVSLAVKALARDKVHESYENYVTRLTTMEPNTVTEVVLAVKEADLRSNLAMMPPPGLANRYLMALEAVTARRLFLKAA